MISIDLDPGIADADDVTGAGHRVLRRQAFRLVLRAIRTEALVDRVGHSVQELVGKLVTKIPFGTVVAFSPQSRF